MKAQSPSSSIRTTRSKRRLVAAQGKPRWTKAAVLLELQSLADPRVRAKMEYFGVRVPDAHGISAPVLHALAKQIGKEHGLALELWGTGIHEARILATLIGESEKVTAPEMDRGSRFRFLGRGRRRLLLSLRAGETRVEQNCRMEP